MANQSTKKIIHRNASFLKKLGWVMTLIHCLVIFLLIVWYRFPIYGMGWLPYYISFPSCFVIFKYLQSLGRTVVLPNGDVGVKIDLLGPGIHQYILDVLYIVLASEFLSVFSGYAWFLLSVIPGYGFFKLFQLFFPGTSVLSYLTSLFHMDKPLDIPQEDVSPKSKRSSKVKKPKMKFIRG